MLQLCHEMVQSVRRGQYLPQPAPKKVNTTISLSHAELSTYAIKTFYSLFFTFNCTLIVSTFSSSRLMDQWRLHVCLQLVKPGVKPALKHLSKNHEGEVLGMPFNALQVCVCLPFKADCVSLVNLVLHGVSIKTWCFCSSGWLRLLVSCQTKLWLSTESLHLLAWKCVSFQSSLPSHQY